MRVEPRLPLVYHDGYDLNFGRHVFPTEKYRLIREKLVREGLAGSDDFLVPHPASCDQLRLVHTEEWLKKLETGTLTYQEVVRLEAPYSRRMVEGFFLAAGGTLLAAEQALRCGIAVNLGGGFHHAFPDHGEGFCAINDIAVAIRALQHSGKIRRALVLDCDVHQGNGTAHIFRDDPNVFTISLHQANNYPVEKPPSTIDLHLADGTGDAEYLDHLWNVFGVALPGFQPDLIVYVAGVDPYYDDQLGGLSLSAEGLMARDAYVFDLALKYGIPVAVTLAGGYAHFLADTVQLHVNTVRAALAALSGNGRACTPLAGADSAS